MRRCRSCPRPTTRLSPYNYAISICADEENRQSHHQTQAAPDAEICDGPAARTAAYVQSHLHRLRPHPRILHVLKDMVPLEKCLAVAKECDAPMVSVCGGEPLIYPKIEELVTGLLKQGRFVYICTNAMFMRKKMKDYLAAIYSPAVEPKLKKLLDQKLISDKDAETIRKSDDAARRRLSSVRRNGCIGTFTWMVWNSRTTSLSSAKACSRNVSRPSRWRKSSATSVATNTTVYKETDVAEIEDMFKFSVRSKWTATRFRPATNTTRRRRTWSRGSANSRKIFSSRAG